MTKPCPCCDRFVNVQSFQFWNGRCQHCSYPITATAIAEERASVAPSNRDVAEFLHYLHDLMEIRSWNVSSRKTTPLLLLANVLLAIGVAIHCVDLAFAVFSWVVMFGACLMAYGWRKSLRCPRCQGRFNFRRLHDWFQPQPIVDQCPHCRLRALSQAEIRHWERMSVTAAAEQPKPTRGCSEWSEAAALRKVATQLGNGK